MLCDHNDWPYSCLSPGYRPLWESCLDCGPWARFAVTQNIPRLECALRPLQHLYFHMNHCTQVNTTHWRRWWSEGNGQ